MTTFNFLGIMNQTQLDGLVAWLDTRKGTHKPISEFWQMRSRQMRKASALVREHYKARDIEPNFVKEVQRPDKDYFIPNFGDDVEPANRMTDIKTPVRSQLKYADEAVFWMHHISTLIERCDDLAQEASEAPERIKVAIAALRTLFDDPRFKDQVLIKKDKESAYRTDEFAKPGTLEINFAKNPAMEEYK